MNILKTTSFLAVCAMCASTTFAQEQQTTVSDATTTEVAKSTTTADKSYLSEYEGKKASVTLINLATKAQTPVLFKSAASESILFSTADGSGELSVPKSGESPFAVKVEVGSNASRINSAYGKGDWADVIIYLRPVIYPLLPMMDMDTTLFNGATYLDVYVNALINDNRLVEASSLISSLSLKDCPNPVVKSALAVAKTLAKNEKATQAIAILERIPLKATNTEIFEDYMSALTEVRKAGKINEASLFYTKLSAIDSPLKNQATIWMIYCDLNLGKKETAEIYLNQLTLTQKDDEFSLLQMTKGLLKATAEKPDLNSVLDSYAEGIVFGSLNDFWMPELLFNAGMLYKKMEKFVPANEIFAQMLAFYPDDVLTARAQKEIVEIKKEEKKDDDDDFGDDDEDDPFGD